MVTEHKQNVVVSSSSLRVLHFLQLCTFAAQMAGDFWEANLEMLNCLVRTSPNNTVRTKLCATFNGPMFKCFVRRSTNNTVRTKLCTTFNCPKMTTRLLVLKPCQISPTVYVYTHVCLLSHRVFVLGVTTLFIHIYTHTHILSVWGEWYYFSQPIDGLICCYETG